MLSLAEGLLSRGHDVLVVCPPRSELGGACEARGVKTYATPMRAELDIKAMLCVARALRRFGAHVAHCHTARAHTLGLVAARLAGTPVTVVSRRVDFKVGTNVFSRIKYRLPVDAIVAVSEAVRRVLVSAGVDGSKIAVVPGGIDAQRYRCGPSAREIREKMGLPDGARLVGSLGSLVPHKGHSVLIEAVAKLSRTHPDLRCVIVGDGELEGRLKSLARDLGVGGVVDFVGFSSDVRTVVPALDVLVHPSNLDASPNVIKEGMAMGVPVVATNVGGIPEIIVDGKSGLLVPPGDPEAMSCAISLALDDHELRKRLIDGGVARALDFSVERTVEETELLYARLLEPEKGDLN